MTYGKLSRSEYERALKKYEKFANNWRKKYHPMYKLPSFEAWIKNNLEASND